MQDTSKRETIKISVVIIAFVIAIPILFLILPKKSDGVWINCELSEISPDMHPKIKEECRKLRSKNLTTT